MSEIVINYKSSAIATMDSSGTSILQTEGKYCEDNIEVVYSRPSAPTFTLQTKSIAFTPAETLQTSSVTFDAGYDGLSAVDVSVAAISSSYVGSGVPRKSAADMTRNKSNITAPSGYYSEAAIYNMSNCAAMLLQSVDANGLVTAVYSIVAAGYQASGSMTHTTQLSSIGATTYTPSTAAQTISSQYFLTGTQTIEAIPSAYIIPTGTSVITTNGIYDVTAFASASVSVAGITPTGTYSVTSNGIYDITAFASVDVQVSGGGGADADTGIIERSISGAYENSEAARVGGYAFYNCASLTAVSFASASLIGSYAFYNCSSLTTANFPSVTTIGSYAFYNCSSLTAVSFASATTIGSSAFFQCINLAVADFPSVTTISSSAFWSCITLSTASFPKVGTIRSSVFGNCWKLLSLYLLGSTVVTLGNVNAFVNTPLSNYTTSTGGVYGSIYVPASLYSTYLTATNWSKYTARLVSV